MMEFLVVSHNLWLVAASLVVALVAGFTGLTLTQDLSQRTVRQRKLAIALASLALGGGIWSMHFVAMLGLQLPIPFYYDAAVTLASALVAILIVSVALTLLHFVKRTPASIVGAGALVAVGILVMHYLGMAGLELCRAVYTPGGILLAVLAALVLCVAAFWVAYGNRRPRNILLGTLCFGVAVFAVHFVAIAGTRFVELPSFSEIGPVMSNEFLAIGVILASFVIFSSFLWVGVTFIVPTSAAASSTVEEAPPPVQLATREVAQPKIAEVVRVPCEKSGEKVFLPLSDVNFIRADGHYTQVYTDKDRLFCVWSVTEARKRLEPSGFLQVHRSYLINPGKVSTFVRRKDAGRCRFTSGNLPDVPVSRSKLKAVEVALGTEPA